MRWLPPPSSASGHHGARVYTRCTGSSPRTVIMLSKSAGAYVARMSAHPCQARRAPARDRNSWPGKRLVHGPRT